MFFRRRKKEWTEEGKAFWESLSETNRQMIMKSTFCRKCGNVEIKDFTGTINDLGDLSLEGTCGTCGRSVGRYVESG